MNKIRRALDSTALFIAMLAFLSLYVAAQFWPASWWFEVRAVKVGPASTGQSVPMLVDRTIHRPFIGEWTVTVKRFVQVGWVNYCSASGRSFYEPGSTLPPDMDLHWWTGGACPSLPEGRYVVETTWTIQPTYSFLPEQRLYATSNIFEVTP